MTLCFHTIFTGVQILLFIQLYAIFVTDILEGNTTQTYKYPNPSPLSPNKDVINGPIKETFVLNCPKCASHFKSTQLLEQHLKSEHNICNYIAGLNTEHIQNGNIDSKTGTIIDEDGAQENEEDDGDMMMSEDAADDADFESPQDNGQDLPYSGGQNVVSNIQKLENRKKY